MQTHLEGLFPGVSETLPVLDLAAEALPWREQPESNLDTAKLRADGDAPGVCDLHLRFDRCTQGRHGWDTCNNTVFHCHRG